MKKLFLLTSFVLMVHSAGGQDWTLIDSGAGLITCDENTKKNLKIIKRSTLWDARDLSENGALDGKYNGNQLFAAWILGPETKEFMSNARVPAWMCKYKVTYPDGKIFESDLQDFFPSGFSFFAFKIGDYKEGVWKIEWFIFNRNTRQITQVATNVFQTTWGKEIKRDQLIIKTK